MTVVSLHAQSAESTRKCRRNLIRVAGPGLFPMELFQVIPQRGNAHVLGAGGGAGAADGVGGGAFPSYGPGCGPAVPYEHALPFE